MSVEPHRSRSPESRANCTTDTALPDARYRRLHGYLRDRLAATDGNELYVKGKFIADEIDLTPRQIGALIVELQEMETDVAIEKWSYTGATTWRITPA